MCKFQSSKEIIINTQYSLCTYPNVIWSFVFILRFITSFEKYFSCDYLDFIWLLYWKDCYSLKTGRSTYIKNLQNIDYFEMKYCIDILELKIYHQSTEIPHAYSSNEIILQKSWIVAT